MVRVHPTALVEPGAELAVIIGGMTGIHQFVRIGEYALGYTSGLNTSQALEQLEQGFRGSPEVQRLADFIKRSRRGISK